MIAPPNWSEPHQTPEFDEFTYIINGKKQFEIDGETVVLEKGQSILIEKGARIRYSNPVSYTHLDVYKRQRLESRRHLQSCL